MRDHKFSSRMDYSRYVGFDISRYSPERMPVLSFYTAESVARGDSTPLPDRAIELLTNYIGELESEITEALRLRDYIEEHREIPKEG